MKDDLLIKELRKGRSQVLKEVYIHLEVIVRMVKNNSGSEEDGDDLFQEAIIIFHRNVIKPEFQLTASIKTYLYAIAQRMWWKKLRSRKLELTSLDSKAEWGIVEAFEFELPTPSNTGLHDQIRELMDQVSGTCKQVLKLFYFQMMSLENIREALNYSSTHVVRQQKYRCLKRIKQQLTQSVAKPK